MHMHMHMYMYMCMYMFVYTSSFPYPNDSLGSVWELWKYVEVEYDGDLCVDGTEGGPLLRAEGPRRLVQAVVQLLEAALKISYDRPTGIHKVVVI